MVALLSRNLGQIPPTGPVEIDWGHPLAQGLRFAVTGASPADLVTNQKGQLIGGSPGNTKLLTTPDGPAFVTTGTDTAIGWQAAPVCSLTGALTVSIGKYRGASSNAVQVAFGCSGSSLMAFVPWIDGITSWYVGGTSMTVAGLTFGHDRWSFSNGPRGQEIWQNGVLRATAAAATRTATTDGFALGNRVSVYAPGGETWTAYPYCYVHGRQLSVDEIRWLRVEPYAFLAQGVNRRIFLMGGGSSVTFRPQIIAA